MPLLKITALVKENESMCALSWSFLPPAVLQQGCLRVWVLPLHHWGSLHFLWPHLSLVLGPRSEGRRFS